jgi:NADPH-dependent glutamate synthase beta subunit-like oxidoreductase/ferredoxin
VTDPITTESNVYNDSLVHPEQLEKLPPCQANCPIGTDVRGWVGLIAQRKRLGYTRDEAYMRAWEHLTEFNPFPATTGRICPHPCTADCNRTEKEGPVAINALERFLGDWAIKKELRIPKLENDTKRESIGVIGAGPAGLSFAYQMARRNYPVTVYEKASEPGGMLRYGIPGYRLPKDILRAEIQRIVDLGVDLQLNAKVGKSVSVDQIRSRHDVLFLGIGAQLSRRLGVPGEDGEGCWTGTTYLRWVNRGRTTALGKRVAVIGGGNTAIDAARAARRSGADVTLLYRRTRNEMPAIESEIEEAVAEDIRFEFLVAPIRIERNGKAIQSVIAQRMELGPPDASGRRSPQPIEGSEVELPFDSVIVAISQEPDWHHLEDLNPSGRQVETTESGRADSDLWAGGDTLRSGIAGLAIAQGRNAAIDVHAGLRDLAPPEHHERPMIPADRIKLDYYRQRDPLTVPRRAVETWLTEPDREIHETISEQAFLEETSRCLSCGQCFGCEHCWTYCNPGGFTRLEEAQPGAYFSLSIEMCEACRKCIEVCPCGFLSVQS